ncbi:MAG: hypothetical protein IPN29_11290 [Saprospiraceae bacterium]|nr:hypothetical protein [Saprospiraceae bacterium]
MSENLIFFLIGVFVCLLLLNVYFRLTVLKHYRYLTRHHVEFNARYLLDRDKMEKEVLPHYPRHRKEIEAFAKNIRRSVTLAAILILLIGAAAILLKW